MTTPLAVTGSTGFVGGFVARELAASGSPLRLLVRDPAKAPQLGEIVQTTYLDAKAEHLAGIETLFMVSAAENEERLAEHFALIDAAAAAGVTHIVYTSFFGAAPDCTFTLGRDHFATEEYITASGIGHTFLRDNLYSDFLPFMVGEDGVIRGPAGDGRAALVSRADVGRVASVVLKNPTAHENVTYNLTGPEAITLTDAAATLTSLGTPATFHNESVAEAYASREPYGAPDWQVDAWVSTYTAIAAGELAAVHHDIELVTGRPAESVAEVLDPKR